MNDSTARLTRVSPNLIHVEHLLKLLDRASFSDALCTDSSIVNQHVDAAGTIEGLSNRLVHRGPRW
jgi:hypothetical protein